MKATRKNTFAEMILKKHVQLFPSLKSLELTSSGKVHGGFGKLAEFTSENDANECLESLGFVATANRIGSFREYVKVGAQ